MSWKVSATGGRVQNTLRLLARVSIREAHTPSTKQPGILEQSLISKHGETVIQPHVSAVVNRFAVSSEVGYLGVIWNIMSLIRC